LEKHERCLLGSNDLTNEPTSCSRLRFDKLIMIQVNEFTFFHGIVPTRARFGALFWTM